MEKYGKRLLAMKQISLPKEFRKVLYIIKLIHKEGSMID